MTPEQERVVKRFRQLVKDASRVGLSLVADAACIAVRFIPTETARSSDDLRDLGVTVSVDDACGGGDINHLGPHGEV